MALPLLRTQTEFAVSLTLVVMSPPLDVSYEQTANRKRPCAYFKRCTPRKAINYDSVALVNQCS
jgi:hypothetical protein